MRNWRNKNQTKGSTGNVDHVISGRPINSKMKREIPEIPDPSPMNFKNPKGTID